MAENNEQACATWRTASYSQANGSCVEVGGLSGGRVIVRDTKDRDGSSIVMTADRWRAFLARALRSDLV